MSGFAVKRGMRKTAVVEIEVSGQSLPSDGDGVITVLVHFFVLHRFPEALDKDVVRASSLYRSC